MQQVLSATVKVTERKTTDDIYGYHPEGYEIECNGGGGCTGSGGGGGNPLRICPDKGQNKCRHRFIKQFPLVATPDIECSVSISSHTATVPGCCARS